MASRTAFCAASSISGCRGVTFAGGGALKAFLVSLVLALVVVGVKVFGRVCCTSPFGVVTGKVEVPTSESDSALEESVAESAGILNTGEASVFGPGFRSTLPMTSSVKIKAKQMAGLQVGSPKIFVVVEVCFVLPVHRKRPMAWRYCWALIIFPKKRGPIREY